MRRGSSTTPRSSGPPVAPPPNPPWASRGPRRAHPESAPGWSSPYRIGHGVMVDGLDVAGVRAALRSAGIDVAGELEPGDDNPVEHVFLKSGVDGTDSCRGRRHVLRTDYLGPYSWLL